MDAENRARSHPLTLDTDTALQSREMGHQPGTTLNGAFDFAYLFPNSPLATTGEVSWQRPGRNRTASIPEFQEPLFPQLAHLQVKELCQSQLLCPWHVRVMSVAMFE